MKDKLFSSPRWFVWFFHLLDKIRISKWLLVIVFILASAVAHHLIAWRDGYLEQGELSTYLGTAAVYWVLIPISWHILSTRAKEKVGKFLSGDEENRKDIPETIIDFNSLPENTSAVLVAIGLVVGYITFIRVAIIAIPISAVVLPWFSLIAWLLGVGLGYLIPARMIRQAMLM